MTRIAVTVLAALLALVATAGAAFVAVIVLAGPHSDLLPAPLQWIVIVAAYVALPLVPAFVGRAVWRRLAPRP